MRCGALALALLTLAALAYLWATTALPDPQHLRARAALGNTRVVDHTGQLLYQLPDPLTGQHAPVALATMPLALQNATVAVEDRTFYQNIGLDLWGIGRALWLNVRAGAPVAGGSTLTQQLARNFLLGPEPAQQRTLIRKLREAILALKLTASYSKPEILALYLNQSYYGGMAYGVEAAAQHVFGKPVRELDLAECALLAGLPQAPSRYDPISGDAAAASARQSEVLGAMVRAGQITASEAAAAQAEPLQFASAPTTMAAPHFVAYVLAQLTAELGSDAVLRGGLTITTTLDADLQAAAQATLAAQIVALNESRGGAPSHRVHNGAVVVLEPHSGAVLAMVGSPDFNDIANQGQVNAALARRQPGSAMKPLTYAAAFERGWTAASTVLDVPSAFATRGGPPYTPENYDRAFHGLLSAREALATSSNVGAVRVLDAIGVPALLEIAGRLGITTLAQDQGRYGLALTLGGGEVTPLELTASYAAFANGGRRIAPFAVLRATDPHGRVVAEAAAADQPAVLSPEVAYLVTDILSDPYARMRAYGSRSALDIDRPAAAKTGTTSDWRDNWTVGYTPQRVVGVWVGNASGQPMEAISGVTGAGPVWHDVMLAAHRGLPTVDFARPAGIVELAVCAEGGLLPSDDCPATRLERFIAGTQPTRRDNSHVRLTVDPTLGCLAPPGYPAARTVSAVFRRLPAAAESWALAAGLPRVPRTRCALPGDQAGSAMPSAASAETSGPLLLQPAPGSVYALSPGVPADRQQITVAAAAGHDGTLTLLIDGQALAHFAAPPFRAFWPLRAGVHTAQAVVEDAAGRRWSSPIVAFTVNAP